MAPRAIPAPISKGSFFLGHLAELQKDWLGTLRRWQKEHGDFVPVRMGPRPAVFIFDPADAQAILVDKYKHFRKNFIIRRSRPLIGNGLLLSEGEFWLRQRRLAQPAFHKARIAVYAETMADITGRALTRWEDGATIDIHAEMMQLTRSIVSSCLFGSDLEPGDEAIEAIIDGLVNDFSNLTNAPLPIPPFIPVRAILRFYRDKAKLDDLIFRFIERRRKESKDHGDLLHMLLMAQDEDGSRMTDRQVRDEAMTLFLAGHETTASALTWAVYFLTQHLDAAERLKDEVDRVLGGRPPRPEDVPLLSYTEAVFKEAMRLYPAAWIMGREVVTPCEIRGYTIPKGWNLLISQWVIHRDARWFEQPDDFIPERWHSERTQNLPMCAYMPFGAGPRQCIGRHFAMMEGVMILAMLVQRFELHRDRSRPVKPVPLVSIRPDGGLWITVKERKRRQTLSGDTRAGRFPFVTEGNSQVSREV